MDGITPKVTIGLNDESMCSDMLNYEDYPFDSSETGDAERIIQKKTNISVRTLCDSLSSRVVEKGSQKTVIIDMGEKKNYAVPPEHFERFFTMYEACRASGASLHYMERQYRDDLTHSGIMIDLDRDQAVSNVQISQNHIVDMTRALCKVIQGAVSLGRNTEYHIFWIRKPAVAFNEHAAPNQPPYRDGLHVLVPDLQVEKPVKTYIVEKFREYMDDIFEDVDNVQPPSEMVDAGCARNPVYFLGSCKPSRRPYNLVYAVRINVIRGEIERETLRVEEVLARPYLAYELSLGMSLKEIGGAPTWLNKRQYAANPDAAGDISRMSEKASEVTVRGAGLADVSYMTNLDAEAREIHRYLELLPIEYARDYNLWFKVIFAIASCGPKYRPIAEWFSKKCPDKYSESGFNKIWAEGLAGRGRPGGVTKGSIRFWAKQASPERFEQMDKTLYRGVLREVIYQFEGRIEHASVARVLKLILGDLFATDIDDELNGRSVAYQWFEYISYEEDAKEPGQLYKWKRRAVPEGLLRFVVDKLPDVYDDMVAEVKAKMADAESKEAISYFGSVAKNIKIWQSKLTNDGFLRGISNQACFRFRMPGLLASLDNDANLIGVGNGVLELYPRLHLHEGFHEFRISKYTNTHWQPYDPDNLYVKKLFAIMRDIYPEEDMLEYILFHDSTGLDAEVSAGILLLITGSGANGKTFCSRLAEECLGNAYAKLGKSGLLTDTVENASAANEAQMDLAGKRFIYFDEFNREETLNIKRIKTFCNPGKQTGRKNYGSQTTYKNICNPKALSNYEFRVICKDYGTWRRLKYYRAKTTFVDEPNPNNPYEKKIDRTIIKDLVMDPAYQRAYFSILAHYRHRLYAEYNNDLASVPCKTLDRETSAFQQRQDNIHRFVLEMIVRTKDESDITTLEEITIKYISWYRTLFGNSVITADTVKGEIENSCLSKHFINSAEHGTKIMRGFRVRDSITDAFRPGEERYKLKK